MNAYTVIALFGFAGLLFMALPGVLRHGHGTAMHRSAHHISTSTSARVLGQLVYLAEPRVLFSILALFGSFARAMQMAGLNSAAAAGIGLAGALLAERMVVNRIWNLLMGFAGKPATPLVQLTFTEATAVTPFHNGKGVVQVIRDGRAVQMAAHLTPEQSALPVQVGDRLQVAEVDAAHERLTVLLH